MSKPNEIIISQSQMKAFEEYKKGDQCGYYFDACYVTKDKGIETKQTGAQLQGSYFEFLATGQNDYYGNEPIPELTKGRDLTAAFKRAKEQADNFSKHVESLGIEIISTGERVIREVEVATPTGGVTKIKCSALLDIRAKLTEQHWEECFPGEEYENRVVIDLKFSGLLDDTFNDFCWGKDFSGARLTNKDKIKIQAIHYSLITGERFIWWVFENKKPLRNLFLPATIDPEATIIHKQNLLRVHSMIKTEQMRGFKPIPSLENCMDCPLSEACPKRAINPIPEPVYITL